MKTRLLSYLMSIQIIVLCVVLFAPIAWMILASFKSRTEITKYPPDLFFTPTLENYQQLFTRTDFLENTMNSIYVAGGSTLLGLLLAVPAAYAISWHRLVWPATLTLFARMAPGTLFLLPWFIMFSNVGLSGTHFALIITHAVITLPIALWTMLPHFDGLPRELTESAQIDGCSGIKILVLIAMPVVMPGLIVAVILSFIFSWNYFLFALALSGISSKTAIVASFNFIGEGVTNWGALMAAATVIAMPPILLTFAIQRKLVAGLSFGAVKG
ncbi:carbohydrate ABC transporter permease [Limnohabitans sp. Rim8]|uniref:carbohydrate ABC transporter permease n=1 Tax=Limnohabitans sp. Rim8 TaxID=1100718 RepID=UPI00260A83B2|nr:carbohydrate ABC transporter permease [Limnohabitans sp. Rim8]